MLEGYTNGILQIVGSIIAIFLVYSKHSILSHNKKRILKYLIPALFAFGVYSLVTAN